MTPIQASREVNENKVWRNLFPEFCRTNLTPKFSIGDNVRLTKKRKYLIKVTRKDGRRRCIQFQKCN